MVSSVVRDANDNALSHMASFVCVQCTEHTIRRPDGSRSLLSRIHQQRTHPEQSRAMARQSRLFVGLALIVLLSSALLASASSATVGAYPRDS
jgi:hypothetical protein